MGIELGALILIASIVAVVVLTLGAVIIFGIVATLSPDDPEPPKHSCSRKGHHDARVD